MTTDSPRPDHETGYYIQPETNISCAELIGDLPFNIGCIIKYVWRHENKNKRRDLEKAIQYILIEIKSKEDLQFGLFVANAKKKLEIIKKYAEYEKKTYKASIFEMCINYTRWREMGTLYEILDCLGAIIKEEYGN